MKLGWVRLGWPSDGSKFGFKLLACLDVIMYTQIMGQVGFGPKGPKLGQVGLGWPLGSIEIGLVSVIGPH